MSWHHYVDQAYWTIKVKTAFIGLLEKLLLGPQSALINPWNIFIINPMVNILNDIVRPIPIIPTIDKVTIKRDIHFRDEHLNVNRIIRR